MKTVSVAISVVWLPVCVIRASSSMFPAEYAAAIPMAYVLGLSPSIRRLRRAKAIALSRSAGVMPPMLVPPVLPRHRVTRLNSLWTLAGRHAVGWGIG